MDESWDCVCLFIGNLKNPCFISIHGRFSELQTLFCLHYGDEKIYWQSYFSKLTLIPSQTQKHTRAVRFGVICICNRMDGSGIWD